MGGVLFSFFLFLDDWFSGFLLLGFLLFSFDVDRFWLFFLPLNRFFFDRLLFFFLIFLF